MSLYKNIGPITFKAQTKNVQIFSTQQYWLLQLKPQSINQSSKKLENACPVLQLKTISQKYNKYFEDTVINIYSQNNKPSSILMNRNLIEEWKFQNSMSIQMLCEVCKALIKSFHIVQENSYIEEIDKQMFFRNLYTNEGFYLNFSNTFNRKNVQNTKNNQKQLIKIITTFLDQNFGKNIHVSYKLLMTKLRKCNDLGQMNDQLQYFQKVYQIGAKKVQKQLKSVKKEPTSGNHQDQGQYLTSKFSQQDFRQNPIKKNHRVYRKKSQQIYEQKIVSKKSGNSDHISATFKKSINLSNLPKSSSSQSFSTQRQPKFSLFSNRNKSSNAVHSNFSNTNRSQYSNAFKTVKGSLFHNKSKSKHKNNMSNTSVDKLLKSNFSNFNQTSTSSMIYSNSTINKNSQKQIQDEKNTKKQSIKPIQILQKKSNEQPDHAAMKQIINKNLKMWKDKRIKQNAYINSKQNTPQQISSKSIKRKHKISKMNTESLKMIEQYKSQNKKQDSPIKSSKKLAKNVSKQDQLNQQSSKQYKTIKQNTQISFLKQQKSKHFIQIDEINVNHTQMKKMENRQLKNVSSQQKINIIQQNQIQQIKLIFKNTDQQQTQRIKAQTKKKKMVDTQKKQPQIKNIQQSNPLDVKSSTKQQQQQKQKNKQKQKTIRKNLTTSQLIQQTLIKQITIKLAKLDLIGECVTNCPKYMTQLGLNDKYLWQLPAFMLYKQFYNKRMQIQENLKTQCLKFKQERPQIINHLKQIQQQNKQLKQSLIKLLKATMKKLKKCGLEKQSQQQVRACLNLDFSRQDYQKLDEISTNFISQLQQTRLENPKALSFEIQYIDAFMIARGCDFDMQLRNNINVENYQSPETMGYFKKRISEVCETVNSK